MLSELFLRLTGWQYEGNRVIPDRCVVLAWPHTSNMDGALLLTLTKSIGLDIAWMIKDDWIKGPLGGALRSAGAVAVNRSGSHNLVEQMVQEFRARSKFVLVIPPEGTRKRTDQWRSGFYHIAAQAEVPIVPGYLDYARKRAGLGKAIPLTGSVKRDMNAIREFYEALKPTARFPKNVGPITLRDEKE